MDANPVLVELTRGNWVENRHRAAFVVRDGNYLSARWPGDVHRFAREFSALLARP